MLALLFAFAVIHSGGAALRVWGEKRIGARAWRLLFAALSIPSAVLVIGYFLAHRYDGVRLWNLQGSAGLIPLIWIGTAISFFFLYPATYNLLEIPALLKPEQRLYATGIIRISRHPQARWPGALVCDPPALDRQQFHAGHLCGADRPSPVRHLARRSAPGCPLRTGLRCRQGQHLGASVSSRARWAPVAGAR